MPFILLFVLALFMFLMISLVVFIQVLSLGKARLTSDPQGHQPPAQADEWARNNGFIFLGNFSTQIAGRSADIAAWRRPDRPTFFCQYVVHAQNQTQTAFDFFTAFAQDVSLTTGSSRDGQLLPCSPGAYMQSFSYQGHDDRWAAHIETENYLMDDGGAQLVEIETPFEELFIASIHKHMKYIRTLPAWPFRGPYWFFIRRFKWHNLSVRQQREKGMIKLPREMPGYQPLKLQTPPV